MHFPHLFEAQLSVLTKEKHVLSLLCSVTLLRFGFLVSRAQSDMLAFKEDRDRKMEVNSTFEASEEDDEMMHMADQRYRLLNSP